MIFNTNYRQGEHSAILLTYIKLPFVIKIFVLSIFERLFYTCLTVFIIYSLYTDGCSHLILCNKFRMVLIGPWYKSLGYRLEFIKLWHIYIPQDLVILFLIASNEGLEEMPHFAAFLHGLLCQTTHFSGFHYKKVNISKDSNHPWKWPSQVWVFTLHSMSSLGLHADRQNCGSAGKMPRLIWVFVGCRNLFAGIFMHWIAYTNSFLN